MADFAELRERMVRDQIEARGIRDSRILDAFRQVPREAFVSREVAHLAYDDCPLPIEAGQTISQPYIVALMIEAAAIGAGDHVLEVGAGSGYAAAVISRLAERVVAIERHPALAMAARERLERLGFSNVRILEGDGTCGWAGGVPYDAILCAASGSHVPRPLVEQLAPDGRLVMPLGEPDGVQRLIKLRRSGEGPMAEQDLGAVRFVPLIGEEGWSDA